MEIKKIEVPIEKLKLNTMTKYFQITNNENQELTKEDINGREAIYKEEKVLGLFKWIDISDQTEESIILQKILKDSSIQIEKNNKILIYLLSIEEKANKTKGQLEEYIKDSWRLALLSSAETYLKELLQLTEAKIEGPGYGNFDLREVPKILDIIEGKKINVKANEQNVLIPAKSVLKIAIPSENQTTKADQCLICIGNRKNCKFC